MCVCSMKILLCGLKCVKWYILVAMPHGFWAFKPFIIFCVYGTEKIISYSVQKNGAWPILLYSYHKTKNVNIFAGHTKELDILEVRVF